MKGIKLQVGKNRILGDVQADFNRAYPFLKIEFYKKHGTRNGARLQQRVKATELLKMAGIKTEGILNINDAMTVGELEQVFRDQFGANVQVSRRSGPIWLETTMTDNWTLKQQNDHGRELSAPLRKTVADDEIDYD